MLKTSVLSPLHNGNLTLIIQKHTYIEKQFKIRKHVFLFLFVTSVSIYVLLQWSEFVHNKGKRIKIRGFNFFLRVSLHSVSF